MPRNAAHDFDFLFGTWQVQHRRLKDRLAGSTEWIEFDGTLRAQPILGGLGNVDDSIFHLPGGSYRGVTVRNVDPASGTWAIWWLDSRFPHTIDVPVIGRFDADGVGRFFADETFRGQPIKVRFLWSHVAPTSCRWEQAFSPDAGRTWETNWVSRFTRQA